MVDGRNVVFKTTKEVKMTRDEFLALDAPEAADVLNGLIAGGKTKDEALAEEGITQADLMKAQIFWVKDEFKARGWGGYTSTKRTGNEAGDDGIGVGQSDPSQGYKGV